MPKLRSVHLDDLDPGDRVTVFTSDSEHRMVRGQYFGIYRSATHRQWYAIVDDGTTEFAGIPTNAIERIERHRKAAKAPVPGPPQAEPVYTQNDQAEDRTWTLLTCGYFLGFIGGLIVASIIFWL